MMKSIQTILFLIIFSTFSFSQAQYQWVRKLVGNSLGNPIDYELNNTDNVYYGTENKIYKSTDRGETFNQLGNDIPSATEVKNIILYDNDPATMLVAVESNVNFAKIFKTTDAGENWFSVLENADFSYFGIPMTPDPANNNIIYCMDGSQFLKSTDFGDNWDLLTTVSGFGNPCDIEVFPQNSNIIVVGDDGNGIFRSTDGGYNWSQVFSTSGEIPTIALTADQTGTGYATKWGGGGGFLKTTNFGETWNPITYFDGINMWGVGISPTLSDYIITGSFTYPYQFYISKDGGVSWIETTRQSSNYSVVIIDTMTVFAAQGNGFYKLESPYFIPVELTSFTAKLIKNNIILNWETATETNNKGFEIERSTVKGEWTKAGFVGGNGTTTENHNYSFVDEYLECGKYLYRLKQIDFDGTYEYSDIVEVDGLKPVEYSLSQNFPNPFNPSTTIEFSLPVDSNVKINLYNLTGEKITELANNNFSAGFHKVIFNSSNISGRFLTKSEVATGIYFYHLKAIGKDGTQFSDTKKMLLIK